jgi:hypothetical protein
VAQAHGRFRDAATILVGFLQLQFGVLTLSLGHVACSHLLGVLTWYLKLNIQNVLFPLIQILSRYTL